MKVATWNVNSLRVRLPHVLLWLEDNPVDALCLQETKVVDADFPKEEIEQAGYQATFAGQKTYNGVAMLTKQTTATVETDIPGLDDPDRRILAATVGDWRILNLYVVNGKEVGDPKYDHKLHWLQKVKEFIELDLQEHEHYLIVGDFNIAPADEDVHDPDLWRERILCSTPEREALAAIKGTGFEDCFRRFEQETESFSWWDYRQGAFRRNIGLRIDLILASPAAAARCTACHIDKNPRRWERPSDHTPVVAEFS